MFRIEKGYVSYEVDVKRSMKPEDYEEMQRLAHESFEQDMELKRILRED